VAVLRAAVVTASDGVATGHRADTSGDAVAALLHRHGLRVDLRPVVPDDRAAIAGVLRRLADADGMALVVVTGGTGFGPRDVTPEAVGDVVERPAPGLPALVRAATRSRVPMADLSRASAGVRGRTLVLAVPGSPAGAVEATEVLLPVLAVVLPELTGTRPDDATTG
jgi:molybdopterin adenylyltransferase